MHFLTKALVVIASILAVVVATLTTAYAMNADRIVQEYRDLEARLATSQGELAASDQRLGALEQAFAVEKRALEEQIADIRRQNEQLQTSLAQANVTAAQERQTRLVTQAKEAAGASAADRLAEITRIQQQELVALRERDIEYREEVIGLRERNENLVSDNNRLLQTSQVYEAQLVELREELERVATLGGGDAVALSGVPEPVTFPVEGRVEQVDRDADRVLVTVDLGRNDAIRENHELHITRDNRYLATIVVIRADLNNSLAGVTRWRDGRPVELRSTDRVMSNQPG